MRIFFNSQVQPQISPNFKSSWGYYKTADKREMGYYTWFFREDLPWIDFIKYSIDNFKDKNKVNIIHFGSSDGSEAISHALGLMSHTTQEETEKFMPIRAYDIKKGLVELSNSGKINIEKGEEITLDQNCPNWKEYLHKIEIKPDVSRCFFHDYIYKNAVNMYTITPELRNKIIFQQGNMFELVQKIQDNSNTIVFCRNCLSYFNVSKAKEFIRNLRNVLHQGSLLCLGNLEHEDIYIEELLQQNKFKKIMHNVYKKL